MAIHSLPLQIPRQRLELGHAYSFRVHFFYWLVGGGVQLGPLSTAATVRSIVPAPGDYDDDGEIGGMIGR
jgi:hypothetical protein